MFATTSLWFPPILSIAAALGVVALVSSKRLADLAKLRIGLGFEVLGSFGIAAAEYQYVQAPIMGVSGIAGFGLSWVVTWVLLFSVLVPDTAPRGCAGGRRVRRPWCRSRMALAWRSATTWP